MGSFRKNIALVLTILALIALVTVPVSIVEAGGYLPMPIIEINSPHNNLGYTTNQVLLNVTVKTWMEGPTNAPNRTISYNLDGGEETPIKAKYQGIFFENNWPYSVVTGEAVLTGLSDGSHTIEVYTYSAIGSRDSAQATFVVNIPTITMNLNSTQVFEANSPIPYSITVNAPLAWFINHTVNGKFTTIGYTLDNKDSFIVASDELGSNESEQSLANKPMSALMNNLSAQQRRLVLTGNLSGLPIGKHFIEAYVIWAYPCDASPNTAVSEAMSFSVSAQPTALIFAVAAGAITTLVVFIIVLLFRRHRKIANSVN